MYILILMYMHVCICTFTQGHLAVTELLENISSIVFQILSLPFPTHFNTLGVKERIPFQNKTSFFCHRCQCEEVPAEG